MLRSRGPAKKSSSWIISGWNATLLKDAARGRQPSRRGRRETIPRVVQARPTASSSSASRASSSRPDEQRDDGLLASEDMDDLQPIGIAILQPFELVEEHHAVGAPISEDH